MEMVIDFCQEMTFRENEEAACSIFFKCWMKGSELDKATSHCAVQLGSCSTHNFFIKL